MKMNLSTYATSVRMATDEFEEPDADVAELLEKLHGATYGRTPDYIDGLPLLDRMVTTLVDAEMEEVILAPEAPYYAALRELLESEGIMVFDVVEFL